MGCDWVWGDLPKGFTRLRVERTRMVAVREGLEAYMSPERLLMDRETGKDGSRFYGRGRLAAVRLDDGGNALVRHYRHGGMLRHLTGGVFCAWPPRPFKELAITEEARHRGVPTVEILAACVDKVFGPFYRGWLVTRELEGARDLWAVVQDDRLEDGSKESLLESAARTVRRMHRQGVYHGDLNLKNILVRREAGKLKSYIIDFDQARFFPGEVPAAKAQGNLARLLRSIAKLDPQRLYLSGSDWDRFVAFYREAGAA